MERGTLLVFDLESRTAAIGWKSGDVDITVISEHLTSQEIGMMLAAYDEPILIKHGTHVQAPIMASADSASMLDAFEDIPLTEYAYLTPLGLRRFWCGYGPLSGRWYVRV